MRIKYIGLKERRADTVAGTGLVWERGQVHPVADTAKAEKLLKHADIWSVDESQPASSVEKKPEEKADKKEQAGDKKEGDGTEQNSQVLRVPLPNLDGMDKTELRTFAQQWYGENIHPSTGLDNMRAKVQGLIQERGRN